LEKEVGSTLICRALCKNRAITVVRNEFHKNAPIKRFACMGGILEFLKSIMLLMILVPYWIIGFELQFLANVFLP